MKRHIIAGILGLAVVAGCASNSDVVSKAEYDQISTGMSYAAVVDIIGAPGEESLSSSVMGGPSVPVDPTTTSEAGIKMYKWKNQDGSTMNAVFMKGKLTIKAQHGLG